MVSINSKHLTFKYGEHATTQGSNMFPVSVIVSKKVAKLAVDRNKLKRRLRELFKPSIKSKYTKGIVYTRKGANKLFFRELEDEAQEILSKIN